MSRNIQNYYVHSENCKMTPPGCFLCLAGKVIKQIKNLSLCPYLNCLIPKSMQPDGVILKYLKLSFYNLTEFIVLNI